MGQEGKQVLAGPEVAVERPDADTRVTVLDGEVRVTFRGQTLTARADETINVPANAPHAFTNAGDKPSQLLCLCAPAGQDEFFTLAGQPVATRTQAPPLDGDAQAAFIAKSTAPSTARQTRYTVDPCTATTVSKGSLSVTFFRRLAFDYREVRRRLILLPGFAAAR